MSKELVISANRHETKVALIEDDQLVEVYFQRSKEYSLAGSIHKGRVTRVLPGMQSAFVDLGLERDTFLYVSDFLEDHEDFDKITGDESQPRGRDRDSDRDRGRDRNRRDSSPRHEGRLTQEKPSNEARTPRDSESSPVALSSASVSSGTPLSGEANEAGDGVHDTPAPVVASGASQADPEGSLTSSAASPRGEGGEDSKERRGRRSRRRRRGGQGFPDSKYSNEGAAPSPRSERSDRPERGSEHSSRSVVTQGVTQGATGPIESAPVESKQPEVAHAETSSAPSAFQRVPDLPPIILPGESLAKYRGVSSATPPPLPPVSAVHASKASNPTASDPAPVEAVHYLPENALPDAPVHHAVSEKVSPPAISEEDISLGTVQEASVRHSGRIDGLSREPKAAEPSAPVEREVVHSPIAPSPFPTEEFFVAAHGAVEEEIGEEVEVEDEAEGTAQIEADVEAEEDEPAVAPMLDDDEDLDIQAMILEHVGELEIESHEDDEIDRVDEAGEGTESGADVIAASDAGTGLPGAGSSAANPQDRSGRFPHRSSRRGRRRGRGGSNSDQNRGNQERGDSPRTEGTSAPPSEARTEERTEGRSDSRSENRGENRSENRGENRGERPDRNLSRPNNVQPLISDLLKEGQEIIVQIAKEPLGQKGARITSHIALPGRYVVYMPTLEHMGVSRKIASDEERLRLKRVLQAKRPGPVGGFITRTAAEGRTEDEIAGDMLFLYNLWQDIRNKAEKRPAPMLLHHDLDIVQRILRDQLADSFKAIWIDNEETYESVLRFVERFQPTLVPKVKLYTREAPIFEAFNITNELEKALRPKVWLKSGGFIVINQTEALVAIDVNTGKYVGKTNRLEDTIVKTNTEAIKEIVRQIRLRDLGGIIVIDFIDMDERKNRTKVMQVLEEAMRVDRAPYKILQFNDFGLVAITRKRVKQSLERTLCSPCPHCEGAGYVKSVQTVVSEILTEARKMSKSVEGKDVMLRVHPEVAKELKSHQNKHLEELEEVLRRPVLVKSDPQLHQEKFDLA